VLGDGLGMRGFMVKSRLPAREEPVLPASVPWRRFAVICDSFTSSSSRAQKAHQCWPSKVSTALRQRQPDLAYINLCKQNLLSSQVRSRHLQRILDFAPDLAALSFGYDDVLSDSFDIGHFESELVRVLMALRHIDCTVLTIGIFDISRPDAPSTRRRQIRRHIDLVCARTAAVAMRYGAINVDMSGYAGSRSADYTDDGLRLNRRGHEIVVAETIRQLGASLGDTSPLT
jgi:hypothetical protein